MAGAGAGYDLSCNTYSPEGKIYQIDYAKKAVENSGTVVGVNCKDGIVVAVEKIKKSKMLVKGSNRRIGMIDRHIGMSFSGFTPDGRKLIEMARKECENYKKNFGVPAPVCVVADRIGYIMQVYTTYGAVRPFGVSVMIFGYDLQLKKYELYSMDATGLRYFATAIGKGQSAAKTEIGKYKIMDMNCEEGLKYAAKILHSVHDEFKDKPFELELAMITENGFRIIPEDITAEINTWVINEIEKEENEED